MSRTKISHLLLSGAGIICSLFILANLTYVVMPGWIVMSVLLAFMCLFGFYLHPLSKERARLRLLDILLIVGGIGACGYVIANHHDLLWRGQVFATQVDLVVFVAGTIIVLELSRRTLGWALPVVAVAALAYAFLGEHLIGLWGHPGFSFSRIMGHTYSEAGIFSIPMRVVVRYVFLFLLFGAFMRLTGVGGAIIAMANAIAGRSRGGPAKVAVIASGLFGSMSGSALANVGTTGAFTIPMMKRLGYEPHFAAAVEAVASTGGQWMPPVMAGTAFILCEFVGIAYAKLIIAAFVPALLYYLCVALQIDLEAVRLNLKGLPPEETPKKLAVLRYDGYLFLPLLVLMMDLLVLGHSVIHAALMAILCCIVVSWIRKQTRMGWRKISQALAEGAQSAVVVTAACSCAGIIIGVLGLTGLGIRLSSLLVELAGGNGFLLLILTGVVALILGMGMPTTGAYIICAVIMAPALVMIGFPILPVHMLILYYAVINCITPPVALAAYFAAGIAGAEPMKTAVTATMLGVMAYIVPILFVYNQEFLLVGSVGGILLTVFLGVAGMFVLAMAINGRFYTGGLTWNPWQRVLLLSASGCLLVPFNPLRLVGLAILGLTIISHRGVSKWVWHTFTKGKAVPSTVTDNVFKRLDKEEADSKDAS